MSHWGPIHWAPMISTFSSNHWERMQLCIGALCYLTFIISTGLLCSVHMPRKNSSISFYLRHILSAGGDVMAHLVRSIIQTCELNWCCWVIAYLIVLTTLTPYCCQFHSMFHSYWCQLDLNVHSCLFFCDCIVQCLFLKYRKMFNIYV